MNGAVIPIVSGKRPQIAVGPDRPRVVDEAEQALVHCGDIFVHGRALSHVVRDRSESRGLKYPDGQPLIARIGRDHLLERLERAVDFVKVSERETRHVAAPGFVASMLIDRGQWPAMPQLDGISDAPILRPDGSIHTTPGYDAHSRMIYAPGATKYPAIADRPSRADALRALEILREPFADFPFVAPCDEAALIALALTLIGRPAIAGAVPMFPVRATAPGSGKGLVVDAVAIIATNRTAPKRAPTTTEDELRKVLFACALEAPPMIDFDNVDGALGSPTLAMAITAGMISDRVLGISENRTLPLRLVFIATGNNLQFKNDMPRRVVPIDLDALVEHPQDRDGWRHPNLLAHVREHRAELVCAALTILRAFVVAGQPRDRRTAFGGFEDWDQLIRGAIVWLGLADPLGGVQRIRSQGDEDADRAKVLINTWSRCVKEPITAAHAVRKAGKAGELFDALAAYCKGDKLDARQLGYALRKIQGRPFGALTFVRDSADRDGVALWRVDDVRVMRGMRGMIQPNTDFPEKVSEPKSSPAYPASPALDHEVSGD